MLDLRLEAQAGQPLVEQIVTGLRGQIDDRVLRSGHRLPPIRRFAEHYGVSRFTVVEAYERLVALGYVQSRRGSGFYVAQRAPTVPAANHAPLSDRAVDVAWMLRRALDAPPDQLRASDGHLPPTWLDDEALRRQIRAIARDEGARLTRYGQAQGWLPLREQLCVRLAEMDVAARPEQIVLTQGATQALDLVARYLVRPGDAVLVEDPGYYNFFGNLRLLGARLIGVPRGPNGPDVEAMEKLAAEHKPRLFFLQSALHNPTGGDLSPALAHRILQCAERHDFLIIEDDIYGDMQAQTSTRLATLDQLTRVIYVGGFSKTLSANLRVGFLAASPDLAQTIGDVKTLCVVSSSEFAERVVWGLLVEGQFRRYMERVRQRLEAARSGAQRMMERVGLELWGEPKGGMFLWARIPGVEDAAPLAEAAAKEGILIAPGHIFRPQMQASPFLRLNAAYASDKRLERFLAQALD
ncbi:PLP-dependent aminotransferase family protein [Niveibacterium sp. SC-1]|uniref:aminotransferase-like domain-containing protein n=1 Tax=Niveibacterium sp. SC-1 TaxID=3135646 RepID=UPI00311FE82E